MGIQADGIFRKMRSKLRWNRSHATRRNGDVAFGKHFKNKFEHSAGGFQLAIEKNSAKKRAKKAVDEFVGESGGDERFVGRAFGMFEDLVNGGSAKAGTQPEDAYFIEKSDAILPQYFAPSAGSTPRMDKLVHAAGKKGEGDGSKLF